MSGDFFKELEAELGSLTQSGMHLDVATQGRRRLLMLARRAVVIIALAVALAASLDSEFPATASGHAPTTHAWAVQGA
jgi:hypothetical protein